MPIDARIPLMAEGVNLAQLNEQAQQRRYREQQMAMQQRQFDAQDAERARQNETRSSLSDLIATRQPNGTFDTHSQAFQRYTKVDPSGALDLIGKMDENQRRATEAGVKDLAAAVQWADSPEKWAVVQRHVAQSNPQAAAVPFERRQEVLVSLGQMGEYLKNTKPEIRATEAGGGLYSVDPRGAGVQTLVAPNDGSQPMGAPVQQSGAIREGATATNPQTGQKIMFQNGQWVPVAGGQTARPSGTFPGRIRGNVGFAGIAGETVTSTKRSASHNKAVGGVPNSYHLTGQARDSVPPRGMTMAAYAEQLRRLNPHLEVINEGDHVHMEPRG